jgi:acid phosphatase
MPFGHKPHRQAVLFALAVAFIMSCQVLLNAPDKSAVALIVYPTAATLQPDQVQDFTAVGLTVAGDTASIAVTWSATGGTVDTNSVGGRHYGHYHNASCGQYTVTATSEPGNLTASASVTVACAIPVATVTVSPASVSLQIGQSSQLTATPKDANGNPLTGRAITWSSSNTAIATVSGSGLVTGVAAGGPATITATSEGRSGSAAVTVTTASAGRFGHVIIVAEENHDYSSVIGNAAMPYLNSLSTQYGLATNYYANAHPSIGNYFELTVGDTIINDDNFTGTVSNNNIIRELVNAGKTWKAYIEGYPSYDANHVPMSYFSDIRNNPAQAAHMVPFTRFATDLANGTLPDFSFITPNICNDAHDCSLGTADSWLQTNIDPLIQSARFQQDGLLVIWWDESASSSANGGGKVAWTVVSPFAKRGYKSTTFYQHQSTLRLMLRALGVSTYPGAAASAPDMSEFFTTGFPTNRGFTTHP